MSSVLYCRDQTCDREQRHYSAECQVYCNWPSVLVAGSDLSGNSCLHNTNVTFWKQEYSTKINKVTLSTEPPRLVNEYQLWLGRQRQVPVWFIPLVDKRGVCRWNCEIPWKCVPYLRALEACSRQGAIQIHVYLTHCRRPCITHHWYWLRFVHSWRLSYSVELVSK